MDRSRNEGQISIGDGKSLFEKRTIHTGDVFEISKCSGSLTYEFNVFRKHVRISNRSYLKAIFEMLLIRSNTMVKHWIIKINLFVNLIIVFQFIHDIAETSSMTNSNAFIYKF